MDRQPDIAPKEKCQHLVLKLFLQAFRKYEYSIISVDSGANLPNLQAVRRRAHLRVSVWNKNY